ncbi:MAG: long-chain-fatty-acid--CoA ligase [Pseudomonadota bacterium]
MSNVGDVIRQRAAERPNKLAMIFGERRSSYQALDVRSNQVANGLLHWELSANARIAYLGKNTDFYFELFFGAAKAGRPMVAINWRLTAQEIGYILNDAHVETLFVEAEFEPIVEACRSTCPKLTRQILLNGNDPSAYESWVSTHSSEDPALAIDGDTTCLQMYTSGTTGKPKGVLLSHACFLAQRELEHLAGPWTHWNDDDVNLVAMPVFHIGGTGWGCAAFFNGATNVIHAIPEAERIVRDIEEHRITRLFAVPTFLQAIVETAKAHATSIDTVKYVVYGASPIPESLLKEAVALFGCGFVQLYGMTEATGSVTYLPPEDHDENGNPRMASCGKALPGMEIKICGPEGNKLPTGVTGEIWVKSDALMTGYWRKPEATAEVLQNGWYKSGDAGYLDADGYLYLQARIKDMIVSGGENIYPAEIESVLFAHPSVADVAVIGVPDEKWGEAVKAIVVPSDNQVVSFDELVTFARDKIAGYKLPRSIDTVDVIPHNASGKILKYVLREPFWKEAEREIG